LEVVEDDSSRPEEVSSWENQASSASVDTVLTASPGIVGSTDDDGIVDLEEFFIGFVTICNFNTSSDVIGDDRIVE